MKEANGFFIDRFGNKSSSRLIGFITVVYALLQSTAIIILGYIDGASLVALAGASGANFVSLAGAAMVYLYNNKSKENERERYK